jgi:hypothetical protein
MNLLTFLRKLCLRLGIGLIGVLFVFPVVLSTGNYGSCLAAEKPQQCKAAEVTLEGQSLNIALNKGVSIKVYPVAILAPKLPSGFRLIEPSLCNNRKGERPELWSAIFRGESLSVFSDLDLPGFGQLDSVAFGKKGIGGWLGGTDANETALNPSNMVVSKKTKNQPPYWQYLQTAGWMPSGYTINSWCVELEQISCAVRITRKKDNVIFEIWKLKLKNMPEENKPPPQEFMDLLKTLPHLPSYLEN